MGKVSDETLRDYKTLHKKIPQEILQKPIQQIKLEEIIMSINSCESERTKQKLHGFYNMIFKKAEDNELINKNPIRLVEQPKHEKEHSQALTNQKQIELERICNNVENGDIILVAMYQGLRRGEILGLTREDIDFDKNTITINKAWKRQNYMGNTKNNQSIRTMPMFTKTKDILTKYKNKKGRIFDITTKQYEILIKNLKEKINISNIKIKDMRATFITRCKELGIHKHVIQAWVGHKIGSIVTDTVYTTYNREIDNKYINILNDSKFYTNSTQEK